MMLLPTLRQKQKVWIGHTMRHDSLLRTVTEGKINRNKPRRRPKNVFGSSYAQKES